MNARLSSALVAAAILGLAPQVAAQSFAYPDFLTTAGLVLNGSASPNGALLELTPNLLSQAGTAFFMDQQPVAAGFDTSFDFQVSPAGPGGADGFTFIIHNDASGTGFLGTNGGSLAYDGLPNSLVIEFDVYTNGNHGDSAGSNEISVHTRGTLANAVNESNSIGRVVPASVNLSDGLTHFVRILYAPGTLDIFVDNFSVPVLSVPYDFTTGGNHVNNNAVVGGLALNDAHAWVGFSAGTGGLSYAHQINSWIWQSVSPWPACMDGTVGTIGGGAPENVLTINGSHGGFFRTETVLVGAPFSIGISQPSLNPLPAPYVIFGLVGPPAPSTVFTTSFGDFCFLPHIIGPSFPWLFTLMDGTGNFPAAIAPTPPAPFTLVAPLGFPFPTTVTLQGAILEDNANITTTRITNGIVLDIVPAPPPMVTSVSPISAAPGGTITINGQGFHPFCVVKANGVTVPTMSVSPTQITFAMPQVSCDVPLTVTNPDGQVATVSVFNPTPIILTTPVTTGAAAGGGIFVMSGQYFAPGTTITVGTVPVTPNVLSSTVISITMPPGNPGPVTVVVTAPNGCFAQTTYTYL